jgi:hypothetical protein
MAEARIFPRQAAAGGTAAGLAARLVELARRVRRLSPDWTRPERFFERRSDIADELRHAARDAERDDTR